MAGTDHSESRDSWAGPQPAVVLVRPQMGENIGGAARAMWNFGLDRMRLVDPRDGWPNPRAAATASGAARVLDNVEVYDTTADALADCHFVLATTARTRDMTKQVMTPEQAMRHIRQLITQGQKVGLLFGPERAGLENDDIARANAIISVPVNPAFASLNLAQCVLLLSYEWRRQAEAMDHAPQDMGKSRPAEAIEIEKLQDHLESRLNDAHFFYPAHKAPSMRLNLRNMLSRMPMTLADVQIFHGVLRALTRNRNGDGSDGGSAEGTNSDSNEDGGGT